MTPNQQLEDLKRQQQQLERQQVIDKTTAIYEAWLPFKGRAFCVISKQKQYGPQMTATYYRDFKLVVDVPEPCVQASLISVTVTALPNFYGKYSIERNARSFKDYGTTIGSEPEKPMHATKNEMEVTQFKKLDKLAKSMPEWIMSTIKGVDEVKWLYTNGDHSEMSGVATTTNLLDIPHITVSDEEAWQIDHCAFLNYRTFLVTPASIKYLKSRASTIEQSNSFNMNLAREFGYSDRPKRLDPIRAVIERAQSQLPDAALNHHPLLGGG